MRALSQTAMKMYERCPQQWKLRYIDGHRELPKPYFNLGSAVHDALEVFYRGRISAPASVEEMTAAFEETFDPEAYATEEEGERSRADGLRMVRDFHAKHSADFRPALGVEETYRFELGGVKLVAKLDRIDKVDDETVDIVDYKTGRAFTRDRVLEDPQLTLYQAGAEAALGMKVESVVLYHVPSQTPFRVQRHGEERMEALRRRVRKVSRGIRREEFAPRKGRHCEWCDFKEWCPAWAHDYPESWAEDPPPPAPTHAEARELADRYGEGKDDIRALKEELEPVREALERYFDGSGARAVAGERYEVSASRSDGVRFEDDDVLRRLLEPLGLWERVLRPDWRAKASILEDPDVPEDLLPRLREIATARDSWTLRVKDREG